MVAAPLGFVLQFGEIGAGRVVNLGKRHRYVLLACVCCDVSLTGGAGVSVPHDFQPRCKIPLGECDRS